MSRASSDSEWECGTLFEDAEPNKCDNSAAEDLAVPMSAMDTNETFTFGAHSVILVRQNRGGAVGAKAWRAAPVCARALLNGVVSLEDKRVLELGAGVGICGILASQLGAKHVVLTDCSYESLKGLLPNVLANSVDQPGVGSALWGADCDRMSIRRHLWETDLPRSPGRGAPNHCSNVSSCAWGLEGMPPELPADSFFDVVIGSDVLYFEPQVAALVATLALRMNQGGHGLITVSVKKHALYERFLAEIPHSGLVLVSEGVVAVDDLDSSHALSVNGPEVLLVHLTKL